MKKTISVLLSVVALATVCHAQSFHLEIFENSNWNIRIDTIQESEFHEEVPKYVGKKKTGDSLLAALAKKYNQTILVFDSCCVLKGIDKDLRFCKRQPSDERQWHGYEAVRYENGYLILSEWGYESWSYVCFDPTSKKYAYTSSEPKFIGKEIIYSAGGVYSDGVFDIVDLVHDKHFGFVTISWDIWRHYQRERSIYLKFMSTLGEYKYLRLSF